MNPRSIFLSLALIFATICLGLMIRLVHMGLPPLIVKYGGSTLWAAMIYWIVSTLMARSRLTLVLWVAILIATAVECAKLYHAPALDAFRHTLPGALLLGRIFSVLDLVAYWLAVGAAVLVDAAIRKQLQFIE